MYDRQTHSLWAQMEGRAIVGALAGTRLGLIPANTVAHEDFKAAYPGGTVLSRDTGHARAYGRNPYEGYDRPESHPFLLQGAPDRRLPPKERVVGVTHGGAPRAYPWSRLVRQGVVHDVVGGEPLVILYRSRALSALDAARVAESRAIGATGASIPVVDGRALTVEPVAGGFRDGETGILWNILSQALSGPLAGKRLRVIPHVDAFWFAWAAFQPRRRSTPRRDGALSAGRPDREPEPRRHRRASSRRAPRRSDSG
jgi:hypothetical protein